MNKNILNKKNLPEWKSLKGINCSDILELYPDLYGFVYLIEYEDNTFYVGRKVFYNTHEVRLLYKDGKAVDFTGSKKLFYKHNEVMESDIHYKRMNHKLVPFTTIKKESNWKKYVGSNETEPINITTRTIINFAYDKLHLTFLENQALYNFITEEGCRNKSISNKIFRDRLLLSEEKRNELINEFNSRNPTTTL